MALTLGELGDQIRAARDERGLTQSALAREAQVNRTAVALLEQGRRLPPLTALEAICGYLDLPRGTWESFLEESVQELVAFEECLAELCGRHVSLRYHDQHAVAVARGLIRALWEIEPRPSNAANARDAFNSILVFYGVRAVTPDFFARFLGPDGMASTERLMAKVRAYQAQAIRLFSTFAEAYDRLNTDRIDEILKPLEAKDDRAYRDRTPWTDLEVVPDDRLRYLGYVAAAQVQRERAEREELAAFMRDLADRIAKDKNALSSLPERKRRRMDSLLRKFKMRIEHGFLSPLFVPDADVLRREADAVAPRVDDDTAQMAYVQEMAQRNLARYLSIDYLDVYVATSMRTHADFVSVNQFVIKLFGHADVAPLNLRFFNPTQSWIEDRVAKGMVEALMLRRSGLTLFMAQKQDSFGKDSEASVALGQGKPVIVYVPRLVVPAVDIDSSQLGQLDIAALQKLLVAVDPTEEVDEGLDRHALLGRLLLLRLHKLSNEQLASVVRDHWADFDLYEEASRVEDAWRSEYRQWLDDVVKDASTPLPGVLREPIIGILVAVSLRFESRAQLFREQHPLALQVILSTGVLNGILVARSVDSCAALVAALVRNALSLELDADEHNYRLVERSTRSVIRVISKHALITNAFGAYYARELKQ